MKIGVLLSGCGVYDGAEIQEAVLTLLAIEEIGAEAVCISLNKNQYHVVNHLTGEVMVETRNMLVESARIARGNVKDITSISPADIDALVIPGGFGSAKNFTTWAFSGAEGTIDDQVKLLLVNLVNVGKPIVALCVSPVVVAKAMEGSSIHPTLTIGTTKDASPYDISTFVSGLNATGAETTLKTITEIEVDLKNRIITAPCYMMETSVLAVRNNIRQALEEVKKILH
jgi:enhancing lycopene biosynthesis protein 2